MKAAAIVILVLFVACMIAGVCLADNPDGDLRAGIRTAVVAPRPTRWLESPHAGQCESQWLRLTPRSGYQRTWVYRDGETWYLVDGVGQAYYSRQLRHGDRY